MRRLDRIVDRQDENRLTPEFLHAAANEQIDGQNSGEDRAQRQYNQRHQHHRRRLVRMLINRGIGPGRTVEGQE